MTQTKQEQAASELLALTIEEGIELPLSIAEILQFEAMGAIVDLITGAVTWNGANERLKPTVIGEATLHLLEVEEGADD